MERKKKFTRTKEQPVLVGDEIIRKWLFAVYPNAKISKNGALKLTAFDKITEDVARRLQGTFFSHMSSDAFKFHSYHVGSTGGYIEFYMTKKDSSSNEKFISRVFMYALSQQNCDILRSENVAVPFMKFSVETLVKKGWIKIIEK